MLSRTTFPVGPLGCNCSILGDTDSKLALVVDPGAESPRILEALARRQWTVTTLLHTHAHIDHVGATGALADATGAAVRWHQSDQFLIDNLALQAELLGLPPPSCTPKLTKAISDGEKLFLAGHEIVVRHVPGHSPGSVMFVLPQEKLVFAGDMIFANGQLGRDDLPGGSSADLHSSLHSVVLKLPDDFLLVPGHGVETTVGRERVFHKL